MSDESLTAKQMDHFSELAEQDNQAAIQRQNQTTSSKVLVKVLVADKVVFSDTYPAVVEGDVTLAIADAIDRARREVNLPLWDWSFKVDKA